MNKKHVLSLAALSILGFANVATAARDDSGKPMTGSDRAAREERARKDMGANRMRAHDQGNMEEFCAPEPPATCYPDDCVRCYCLGPDVYGANAPVCPKTCNGDFIIDVSGLYWIAHEDGLEYAIYDNITVPDPVEVGTATNVLNQVVDAQFLTPHFRWDWGFKAGLGYCTTCDGWDFELVWTWYKGKANDTVEADAEDNAALINLWSAYASPADNGTSITFARNIDTSWHLKLNLVDLEVGRNFWTSRYLSLRPFVGVRYASIRQDFDIESAGGVFNAFPGVITAVINHVDLENDFRGAGVRAGLDSYWNVGCGWAAYGEIAASLIYGRFNTELEEWNTTATSTTTGTLGGPIGPAGTKQKIIEDLYDNFRASRAILDLALGIQWATMFCDCQYGFTIALGWEQHLFFDQNQLWSVVRIGDIGGGAVPNLTGENVYTHRRGDLDTAGFTLTVKFEF